MTRALTVAGHLTAAAIAIGTVWTTVAVGIITARTIEYRNRRNRGRP